MRALVISDTHIPVTKDKLPSIIEEELKNSDCCIHCGDFITYSVFETINSLCKIYGVYGNMDDDSVRERLPLKQIIKLEDVTLGIIHGKGHPNGLINYINTEFKDNFNEIDIFVFGHSHYPLDKAVDGKIYFNPGSCTDTAFAPYCSYGIFEINGRDVKRRLVKIE